MANFPTPIPYSITLFTGLVVTVFGGCGTDVPLQTEELTCSGNECILQGVILEDTTLTADVIWRLRGGVFVGDAASQTTLVIEPGTEIRGEVETLGHLVIAKGSQIIAEGTRDAPIVFTSSRPVGQRTRGDWGGVVLNGRASVNSARFAGDPLGCSNNTVCQGFGEGATGFYGGSDDDDSSGVLRYVRIEFAGQQIAGTNELNGLALQGVGSETRLEFIQVHMGQDDGVEFFGGTATFRHLLITGASDDSLDWTDGWRGRGQFLIIQQYDDTGDNGIEADNSSFDNAAAPRSSPILSNATIVGSPMSADSDIGMLLREGTAASIHNAAVLGFNDVCLDIDQEETFQNTTNPGGMLNGELALENSVVDCVTNFEEDDEAEDFTQPFTVESWFLSGAGNAEVNPMLAAPLDTASPDFRPAAGSPLLSGAVIPLDPFFETVEFRGGVDPSDDWTTGWTTSARN